jgi:hypothetical protein
LKLLNPYSPKSNYKPESERVYSNKKKQKQKVERLEKEKQDKDLKDKELANSLSIIPEVREKTFLEDQSDSNTPNNTLIKSELELGTNSISLSTTDSLGEKIDYNLDLKKIKSMKEFEEELDYGNVEYKLKLLNKTKERIQGLITQMEFRLREGHGTCFYEIGVEDNGNPLGLNDEELKMSLDTLYSMTLQISAKMNIMNYFKGKEGLIAEIMITKNDQQKESQDKPEVRIGLIGEEGSGKSTLVNKFVYFFVFFFEFFEILKFFQIL